MKKLLLLATILISGFAFSQKKFGVYDMLTVLKLDKEQLEAKYDLTPTSSKTQGTSMSYIYSGINELKSDFTLTIKVNKGSITEAWLLTESPQRNDTYSNLMYAFTQWERQWFLIDNKTKKAIPYFTKDEFSDAAYVNGYMDETLKTKTSKVVSLINGVTITFILTQDNFSIISTNEPLKKQ